MFPRDVCLTVPQRQDADGFCTYWLVAPQGRADASDIPAPESAFATAVDTTHERVEYLGNGGGIGAWRQNEGGEVFVESLLQTESLVRDGLEPRVEVVASKHCAQGRGAGIGYRYGYVRLVVSAVRVRVVGVKR